jgi:hypothetical protein
LAGSAQAFVSAGGPGVSWPVPHAQTGMSKPMMAAHHGAFLLIRMFSRAGGARR